MARIAGITIPDKKRIEIALAYVYGIGPSASREILAAAKVNPDTRSDKLAQDEINRLREVIEKNYKIEGDLRREIMMNVKRLKDMGHTAVSGICGVCRLGVSAPRLIPGRGAGMFVRPWDREEAGGITHVKLKMQKSKLKITTWQAGL